MMMIFTFFFCVVVVGQVSSQMATPESWEETKRVSQPVVVLTSVYNSSDLRRQKLSNMAWEDGIYMSRDGLYLYSTYFLADVLTLVLDSIDILTWYQYERGRDIGQDFTHPIPPATTKWLHADVAVATRPNLEVDFTSNWTLSALRGQFYNYGAAQGYVNEDDVTAAYDVFAYTHDSTGQIGVKLMKGIGRNLSADTGTYLPSNVMITGANVDNPHVEVIEGNTSRLVLFFDSDNYPNQLGPRDIWYILSNDGGLTWTNATGVSSINTPGDEQQPHLYKNATCGCYYLYYTATSPVDSKLAIWRARQGVSGNWDSWTDKEEVVRAGGSIAVGEPSVNEWGDLAFVSICQNTIGGTSMDKYDADPFLVRLIRRPPEPTPTASPTQSPSQSPTQSQTQSPSSEYTESESPVSSSPSSSSFASIVSTLPLVFFFFITLFVD